MTLTELLAQTTDLLYPFNCKINDSVATTDESIPCGISGIASIQFDVVALFTELDADIIFHILFDQI